MLLRDANPSDFPQILKLNEESVNFLSPLTPVRLEHLHKEATYHRVLETGGNVTAFLLAFREGCTYDSPNYRWFAENYDRFIYIDRIVVSLEQIEKAFSKLSEFPERGSYPQELLALGIREYRDIFFKPYRIICRVMDKNVYVLLIVDGRRDMQSLLQRRLLDA